MGLFGKKKKKLPDDVISGTDEYPHNSSVYEYLLSRLEQEEGDFVTFSEKGNPDKWIQVALEPDGNITINMQYVYADDPLPLISERIYSIPSGFKIQEWEPDTMLMMSIPHVPYSALSTILDELFMKMLGSPAEFNIEGSLE